MLVEIESFVNWQRRRNPNARTWRDYSYDLKQFVAVVVVIKPINHEHYCDGLPDWLVKQLERYQHLMQRNWRPARLNQQMRCF